MPKQKKQKKTIQIGSKTRKESFVKQFTRFNELRLKHRYCNIILRSGDGKEIHAHRNILDAGSRYFQSLFSSGMKDSNADVINLNNMKGVNLNRVISFIYTGELEANNVNAIEEIAQYANYLQIEDLTSECAQFLSKIVDDKNCLKYWRLGQECCEENLNKTCISHIIASKNQLYRNEEFLEQLETNEMRTLLGDKRLQCTEESKFDLILKWAKKKANNTLSNTFCETEPNTKSNNSSTTESKLSSNTENFSKILIDLIECIEFPLMSKNYIFSMLQNDDLIGNKDILKRIADLSTNEKLPILLSRVYEPKERLFAFYGNEVRTMSEEGNFELFCSRTKATQRFGHTVFSNRFLICGGEVEKSKSAFELTNCCKYFNPGTKQWNYFPPLEFARDSHECIYVNNKIYCCGGYIRTTNVKDTTNKVEIFDCGMEKWQSGPNLNARRCNFGLVSVNRSIYALGGSNGTVERLDNRTPEWCVISRYFPPSHYTQCITLGTDIYCFQVYKGITVFDTRMNSLKEWRGSQEFSYQVKDVFKICKFNEGASILLKKSNEIPVNFYRYGIDGYLVFVKESIFKTDYQEGALVSLYD